MIDPPRQNWRLYEALCRKEHEEWLRGLTPAQGLVILESLHRLAASLAEVRGSAGAADDAAWQEKIDLRRRMCDYFARLDQYRRDRSAAQDPGGCG